jgi:predicted DNA-binding mobile mystery protein A
MKTEDRIGDQFNLVKQRSLRGTRRRRLDQRLEGLDQQIGQRPLGGWISTIRDALGMSQLELASRLGVCPSRVSQMERAELDGSMRLGTLQNAAAAMSCDLLYVLVPRIPLDTMVRQQAESKARLQLAAEQDAIDRARAHNDRGANVVTNDALVARAERIATLADELAETRGLWTFRLLSR